MEASLFGSLVAILGSFGLLLEIRTVRGACFQITPGRCWERFLPKKGEKRQATRRPASREEAERAMRYGAWFRFLSPGQGEADVRPIRRAAFLNLLGRVRAQEEEHSRAMKAWEAENREALEAARLWDERKSGWGLWGERPEVPPPPSRPDFGWVREEIAALTVPRITLPLPTGGEVVVPNHLRRNLPASAWTALRGEAGQVFDQLVRELGGDTVAEEATVTIETSARRGWGTQRVVVGDDDPCAFWARTGWKKNPYTGAGTPVWGKFVRKGVKPATSRRLTLKLRGIDLDAGTAEVVWAYVGDPAPAWPGSPSEGPDSRPFWANHALLEGAVPVYPGTETRDPWGIPPEETLEEAWKGLSS